MLAKKSWLFEDKMLTSAKQKDYCIFICSSLEFFHSTQNGPLWKYCCKSGCYGIQANNHFLCEWSRNYLVELTKWSSCVVKTYLHGVLPVCFYHVTTTFRMNLHSVISKTSWNSLPETNELSEIQLTTAEFRTTAT